MGIIQAPSHAFPLGVSTFGRSPRAGTAFNNIVIDVDASGWTNPGNVGITLQASFDGGNTFTVLAGAFVEGPPPLTFKTITTSTIHLNWSGDPPMSPDSLQIRVDNQTGAPVTLGPSTITWSP